MREPWDDPTYEAWRVFVDYLLDSQASDMRIERAVRIVLGFTSTPKLGLVSDWRTPGKGGFPDWTDSNISVLPGGEDWLQLERHHFRWLLPDDFVRFETSLERYLATPADFPGMVKLHRPGSLVRNWRGTPFVRGFYRHLASGAVARHHAGEIEVQQKTADGGWTPWKPWRG